MPRPFKTIVEWVKTIENEILEMDISSRKLQTNYWFDFVGQLKADLDQYEIPEELDKDITKGWYKDRFLDWTNMEIEMFLKPISESFWKRIPLAFQLVFLSKYPTNFENKLYEICSPNEREAKKMLITFSKSEGKITYTIKLK